MLADEGMVVGGINLVKRQTTLSRTRCLVFRAVSLRKEMPLHASNVAMFNPATGKADRVGFKVLKMVRKFVSSSPPKSRLSA